MYILKKKKRWNLLTLILCEQSCYFSLQLFLFAAPGTMESDTRFAHLLQPIRDLAKNWEVDIASHLEDYVTEVWLGSFLLCVCVCVGGVMKV